MEDVLKTYAQPYGAAFPVVCMNEQPVQLTKETQEPIAATREHPRRADWTLEMDELLRTRYAGAEKARVKLKSPYLNL